MGSQRLSRAFGRSTFLIAASIGLLSSPARAAPVVGVDRDAAVAQIRFIAQRIEAAQKAAAAGGPTALVAIAAILAEATHALSSLQEGVASGPTARLVGPDEPVSEGANAGARPVIPAVLMTPLAFQSLLSMISREPFDGDKLGMVEGQLGTWVLSAAQAVAILSQFKFSDKRLQVLKLLAPRLVDRPFRAALEPFFPLISNMEEALRIVGDTR